MTQGYHILRREETTVRQCGIQTRGGVTLAEDKAVTVSPLGIFRINIQFLKIQIRKQLSSGKTSAGVAGFGTVGTFNNAHAHLAGYNFQSFFLCQIHRASEIKT